MRKPWLVGIVLVAAALAPWRERNAESDAVLVVVQQFFDAMATRDVAQARAALLPEGRFYSVRDQDGAPVVRTFTNQESFETWGAQPEAFLERMWNPEVRIHGRIATVWTRYDFHRDGKFSHCGVDAFQLVRTADGWKISNGIYTVERTGCPDSPLGPPGEGR